MADKRDQIREELGRLVDAGEDLRLGQHLRRMPDEERQKTMEKLETAWKKSAKGKRQQKRKTTMGEVRS